MFYNSQFHSIMNYSPESFYDTESEDNSDNEIQYEQAVMAIKQGDLSLVTWISKQHKT